AGLLALISFLIEMDYEEKSIVASIFAIASVIINGVPIIWGAINGIYERRVNVDELVSIAIIASLIKGEFVTAAVVSFVMVLGALIEEITSESARKAIHALVKISPQMANLIKDGEIQTISIEKIKVGHILLVKPGERIPVDGEIRAGITAVDESSMTGEPIPKEKTIGDEVFAGSLNQNGVIEIKTNKVGEDTTLGKIIKLVSESEAYKPETIKIIDKYASWFTPTILACAALAWFLTGVSDRAITVLIVGCPCALILATPTAIVAAISRAAKSGILVKGGRYLEDMGKAKVLLFDKTGTLTEGSPRVENIFVFGGHEEKDLLSKAASVEQNSTHPLARAIIKAAQYAKITIIKAEELFNEIGLGIRGIVNGNLVEVGSTYFSGGISSLPEEFKVPVENIKKKGATPLVVYQDKIALGVISVSDHVRELADKTIRSLRKLGIKNIGILSGDHEGSVKLVAKSVGITDFWFSLNPHAKLEVIRKFQNSGNMVIFVGDGINDAPALTTANVGIAMGATGTDVALETADIALMNDDITKLPYLIKLSRRMIKTIKWNIAFGMVFNAFAVIASGSGYLTPIMGAVVHNIGSVLVVLSSASIVFKSE
ncbi:cation-translocating P-type ATPase, partial [bacterium]|nr:cation-translocating P-type ATPase [bacterium]